MADPTALPEPLAPVHGAVVRGADAKLTWRGVEGAEGYHVQVAADEAFTKLAVDAPVGAATTLTVQNVLGGASGLVWWRVAARTASGRGAFCKDAEFQLAPAGADAEPSRVGATPEAGSQAGREAAREQGANSARAGRMGRREYYGLIGATLLTIFGIVVAFVLFPGLEGLPDEVRAADDSTRNALRAEQDSMTFRLHRFTRADSARYTIPIDSAIAERVRLAVPAGAVELLPDAR